MKNNILNIATIFSGIGSPEFALRRAGIPHKLIFACDNGEIDLQLLPQEEQKE